MKNAQVWEKLNVYHRNIILRKALWIKSVAVVRVSLSTLQRVARVVFRDVTSRWEHAELWISAVDCSNNMRQRMMRMRPTFGMKPKGAEKRR